MITRKLFKLIGIIALAAVIGISMTACGDDDKDGDGGGGGVDGDGVNGEFYAASIDLSGEGIIRVNFRTMSDQTHYDGTLENIKQEFTVTIDGIKVAINNFVCNTGVNGGSFILITDGGSGSGQHDVKVTYKASSPNRFYIMYNNKKYFIDSFELTKKDTFSHLIL